MFQFMAAGFINFTMDFAVDARKAIFGFTESVKRVHTAHFSMALTARVWKSQLVMTRIKSGMGRSVCVWMDFSRWEIHA